MRHQLPMRPKMVCFCFHCLVCKVGSIDWDTLKTITPRLRSMSLIGNSPDPIDGADEPEQDGAAEKKKKVLHPFHFIELALALKSSHVLLREKCAPSEEEDNVPFIGTLHSLGASTCY